MTDKLDGRKRTAMYFGDASPLGFLDWYYDIKENLKKDGFEITHLGQEIKGKKSYRITQKKRTENRNIDLYKKNPIQAVSWDVYIIDENEENLSNKYRLHIRISSTKHIHCLNKICAIVSFDYTLINKLDIKKYIEITKKYTEWKEEVIFDCGSQDIPFNYGIMKGTSGFKEFKLLRNK